MKIIAILLSTLMVLIFSIHVQAQALAECTDEAFINKTPNTKCPSGRSYEGSCVGCDLRNGILGCGQCKRTENIPMYSDINIRSPECTQTENKKVDLQNNEGWLMCIPSSR